MNNNAPNGASNTIGIDQKKSIIIVRNDSRKYPYQSNFILLEPHLIHDSLNLTDPLIHNIFSSMI